MTSTHTTLVTAAPADPVTARRRVEEAFAKGTRIAVPTSGSTGTSRLVAISAPALRASGEATARRLGGHGHWLLALPTTHVAGLQVVARSVLAGTTPVTLPTGGFRTETFVAATRELGGGRHYTSLVPTQAHRLLDDAERGDPSGLAALAGYDAVLLGGAACPPRLSAALRDAGVTVVTTYGMSETAGGCVYDGRPLDGVGLRIRDGRVEISGPVLADEYLDDPASTADAFVTEAGSRWLRTQDAGELAPDGTLTVLGRVDDVIITGGVNVAPAPVEALLSGWSGIGECCVVGVPDEEWGAIVVAVVTGRPEPGELLARVRSRVTDILGAPSAPRHVLVVDELARRGPGKVDRRATAMLAADRLRGSAPTTAH